MDHLRSSGIQQLVSCPYTPQQNGLAEHRHRHITELGLSMMFQSKTPQKFLVEAFYTANFLCNMLPSSVLDDRRSPFEVLNNKDPDYSALRSFGCIVIQCSEIIKLQNLILNLFTAFFWDTMTNTKVIAACTLQQGMFTYLRHVLFDELSFPFATIYKNAHPQAVTPSLDAWQRSFLPSVTKDSDKTTSATDAPVVSSRMSLPSRSLNIFSETDFPPLQPSSRVTGSADSATEVTVSNPKKCESRTTLSRQHNVLASTSQHSMITRSKLGIRKPNPKYALLTHRTANTTPTTVAAALKDPQWNMQ